MSEQSENDSKYVVNCRKCDYHTVKPDMQNADLARDQHEKEMFNWRGDSDACGPVAVARMRSPSTDTPLGGDS